MNTSPYNRDAAQHNWGAAVPWGSATQTRRVLNRGRHRALSLGETAHGDGPRAEMMLPQMGRGARDTHF